MKPILTAYLLAFTSMHFLLAQPNTEVYYVELKEGQEITGSPVMKYVSEPGEGRPYELRLYPDITFQTMEGIGGAFNEIGGEALMSLSESDRNDVMKNLFSEDGASFTYCRTAIGASDFGLDAYSYSEVNGDYKMKEFSIEREKTSVIPYIQLAYKYNPSLKLFASPWSPPGWMKVSGTMDQGEDNPEACQLINDPKIYQAYALYLTKYIQAYEKEGITVDRLMIQNEQDAITKYPSNYMPPSEMGPFIVNYLKPQFAKDNISTQLWAGTFRTAHKLQMLEFANNNEWMASVEGLGIQYTANEHLMNLKTLRPDVKLFHTEGNCDNGKNNIQQGFNRFDELASYINYGLPNYCYWNMILNETTKSGWDWAQNSMINIDRENKSVTYNPDYAAMCLFGQFIRPGVKRIASKVRRAGAITFIDEEQNIIVFLKNQGEKPAIYDLKTDESSSSRVEIPANALAVVRMSEE